MDPHAAATALSAERTRDSLSDARHPAEASGTETEMATAMATPRARRYYDAGCGELGHRAVVARVVRPKRGGRCGGVEASVSGRPRLACANGRCRCGGEEACRTVSGKERSSGHGHAVAGGVGEA